MFNYIQFVIRQYRFQIQNKYKIIAFVEIPLFLISANPKILESMHA